MRLINLTILFVTISVSHAQFFNAIRNLFAPVTNLFGGGRFQDDGTRSPQATGREELFPSDCGRDPNQGTGKLCFPDGLLCKDSKYLSRSKLGFNSGIFFDLNLTVAEMWRAGSVSGVLSYSELNNRFCMLDPAWKSLDLCFQPNLTWPSSGPTWTRKEVLLEYFSNSRDDTYANSNNKTIIYV